MLRTVVAELLASCQADAIPYDQEEEDQANELLARLPPSSEPATARSAPSRYPPPPAAPRMYCSRWRTGRASTIRKRQHPVPGRSAAAVPRPRKEVLDPAED
ncbi:hypothetical protein AB0B01_12110 [Streptomyces sp. NPDC044571]|uniref:hypothetical protein n=1 Tax=Streptomyces sp. NPDC044571 TaxID=3155371 RepID=UPI0033F5756E